MTRRIAPEATTLPASRRDASLAADCAGKRLAGRDGAVDAKQTYPDGPPVMTPDAFREWAKERRRLWVGRTVIFGPAETQGSKRIGRAGKNGRPILVEDNPRLKSWRLELKYAMLETAPRYPEPDGEYRPWLNRAVQVRLIVHVKRPRSHYGTGRNAETLKANAPTVPPTGKDLDKIQRAVGDAGTGVWWEDDAQIARWSASRVYAEGLGERTEVEAWLLDWERDP